MSISRISIGGILLSIETHIFNCTVDVKRHASGRRSFSISATGQWAPDLSAVNWSAPVVFAWEDLALDGAQTTLTVWSAGLQRADDLRAVTASWTLAGVEASGVSALVTIAGTAYWAQVRREPIGGTIQRKTNGAGTLLKAWGKSRVMITGEGGAAPSVNAGIVAVSSTIYTGNLLVYGVGGSLDPETGLVFWSVEGEQP